MSIDKEKLFPLLAMFILLLSIGTSLFVHATQSNQSIESNTIIINNTQYNINTLFEEFQEITIYTDDGNKTGISLSDVILSTTIDCPTCHHYSIKAFDGYQQTVSWNEMQQGIITKDKRSYFPDLAHAYWVRDIIEIEVI